MDLVYSEESKKKTNLNKERGKVYFDYFSSFEKVNKFRPLTFSLTFNKDLQKNLNLKNYKCFKLNTKTFIGVRCDMHTLGFSIEMLKKLIENRKNTKADIENKVLLFLIDKGEKNIDFQEMTNLKYCLCFLNKLCLLKYLIFMNYLFLWG